MAASTSAQPAPSDDSGSPEHPFRALPSQFRKNDIVPIRHTRDGVREPVWRRDRTDTGKKHAVLNWLATHCSAPNVLSVAYADRHEVFTANACPTPFDVCITLTPGVHIHPRKDGSGYFRVVLGKQKVGKSRKRPKWHEVDIDAHRLVCWLTQEDPPADPKHAYAIHFHCHNKACVKAEHLRWDTQSTNIQQAWDLSIEKQTVDKARRQGAAAASSQDLVHFGRHFFAASCCMLLTVHVQLVDVCQCRACIPSGGSSRVSGPARCGHAGALRSLPVGNVSAAADSRPGYQVRSARLRRRRWRAAALPRAQRQKKMILRVICCIWWKPTQ